MKRIIKILATVIFAAMLMACICPITFAADADTLTVTSAEVTGERGETVEVSLVVVENPGFAALRITVEETEGFTVTETTNGTVMKTMTSKKNILWDDSKNSTKTGVLVTLKITIDADATAGRNIINVTLRECYNADLKKVNVSIAPIVINVTAPADADPVETDPIVTDPVDTTPVETDPIVSDPIETDPIETDPVESDSSSESANDKPSKFPEASDTETKTETNTETQDVATEPENETQTGNEIESSDDISADSSSTEAVGETEPAAPADTLVIEIEEVSAARGDVIKVVLNVTANPGISGLIITVPEISGFDLRDVANGTVMDTMTSGINILWDGLSDSTETGRLVTLTYMVSDSAPLGNNSVSIKVRSCFNASGKEVAVVIDPIVITVAGENSEGANTETPDGGNDADTGNGCAGGCSGEIGVGAIIITTFIAGTWFFKKKH